jgi:hypothetical protein
MRGGGDAMKRIICIAIVLTLTGLMGCAKQDKAPVQSPETKVEQRPTSEPISTEDFESGEVAGAVESDDAAEGEDPETPGE